LSYIFKENTDNFTAIDNGYLNALAAKARDIGYEHFLINDPNIEPHTRSFYIMRYARNVIGKRWPEAESRLKETNSLPAYFRSVISGKKDESSINSEEIADFISNPVDALKYANKINNFRRFPCLERSIIKNPRVTYDYMISRSDTRNWAEGRRIISQNAALATNYARRVLDGPFPEAEDAIASDAGASLKYAQLLGHRFIKGEAALAADPDFGLDYAVAFKIRLPDMDNNIKPRHERLPIYDRYMRLIQMDQLRQAKDDISKGWDDSELLD
jgi:hypothetical protein